MNANSLLKAACAALLLLGSTMGYAWKMPDIPDIQEDPMSANPPMLKTGSILPGDDLPVFCPPQVDLSRVLALGEAVDMALCYNAQVKAAWATIKVQAGALGETWATFMPTLTGTYSLLNSTTLYPNYPGSNTSALGHVTYLGFNWRIFDFGARIDNLESANQLLMAALADDDAALQKVLIAVISAYFDAMTNQAVMQARVAAAGLADDTYHATLQREVKGVAAASDTLQAATALAKAQLAEQRAIGEYHKSLSVLVYAMGLSPSTLIILPENLDAPQPQAISDLTQWLTDAEKKHPAIIAARAQMEAAQAKIKAVRAEGLPTVDFTANYYQNGYPNQGLQTTNSNTTSFGVVLTIPFFDGFARTYKVRGAQAQAEHSEAQLQDTEQQILAEVVKAHADAVSALGNLDASRRLLEAAAAAVASSQRRYDKGAADILELLSTEAAFADARQERIRCLAEWQSARLRLMASAGILGRLELNQVAAVPSGITRQTMAKP